MTAHISQLPKFVALGELGRRAEIVAATAAAHADKVDRDARFPAEAFAEARAQRLLGVTVPADLGGENASIGEVVDLCYLLGRACASTGMIFAMHQIMAAILVRHAGDSFWHRRLLQRLCSEQLLLASSTTDGGGGGDLRASACAVTPNGARIALQKNAAVMSYGAEADAVLTTARRSPQSDPADQVLVALVKGDYRLERSGTWDALGMRGTCSAGFVLAAEGAPEQVLPAAYSQIHAQSMMPIAHLTWSAVWCGVAAGAVERARLFMRAAARRGGTPPGAAHFTRAMASLRMLRGMIASELQRFEACDQGSLETIECQTALNLLKVNASELAGTTVTSALHACGLAGYRNDGEFSVSRHLRDILSAPIMINNDRILAGAANASMLIEVPASLRN